MEYSANSLAILFLEFPDIVDIFGFSYSLYNTKSIAS